jgi:hypothetical protein
MKSLVFVFALLVLTGVSASGVQSKTANQRQNSAEQVSGIPMVVPSAIRSRPFVTSYAPPNNRCGDFCYFTPLK